MKHCYKCDKTKPLTSFSKSRRDGYQSSCKQCEKINRELNKEKRNMQIKLWTIENKDLKKQIDKNYRIKNKETLKEKASNYYKNTKEKRLDYAEKYRIENKDKCSQSKKAWVKTKSKCPIFKLKKFVRYSAWRALKQNKTTSSFSLLGCSIQELKNHLINKFKPGMTIENYGQWHIDHIIPLASAKTQAEIEKLCHYTNLQPLWAKENLKKGKSFNISNSY